MHSSGVGICSMVVRQNDVIQFCRLTVQNHFATEEHGEIVIKSESDSSRKCPELASEQHSLHAEMGSINF